LHNIFQEHNPDIIWDLSVLIHFIFTSPCEYAGFHLVVPLITEHIIDVSPTAHKRIGVVLARCWHIRCSTPVVGYIQHWNLCVYRHKVWGKLHHGTVWF
jgi:hypothetical protein